MTILHKPKKLTHCYDPVAIIFQVPHLLVKNAGGDTEVRFTIFSKMMVG